MEFFKSREFLILAGANAIFPTLVLLVLSGMNLGFDGNIMFLFVVVGLIQAANVFGIIKFPKRRILFGITIFLNLFALFSLSGVSFFTSIPQIPFLFESIFSGDWSS